MNSQCERMIIYDAISLTRGCSNCIIVDWILSDFLLMTRIDLAFASIWPLCLSEAILPPFYKMKYGCNADCGIINSRRFEQKSRSFEIRKFPFRSAVANRSKEDWQIRCLFSFFQSERVNSSPARVAWIRETFPPFEYILFIISVLSRFNYSSIRILSDSSPMGPSVHWN